LAAAAVAAITLSACGGGKSSHATTIPPDQRTVPAEEATQGLSDFVAAVDKVASSVASGTTVPDAATQIGAYWTLVEGTVKANDASTFNTIQTALDQLNKAAASGDKASAASEKTTIDSAVKSYQAAHP
jgi:hypothetical protein